MFRIVSKMFLAFTVLFGVPAAHGEWYIGIAAGVSTYDLPGDIEETFGELDELTGMIDSIPGIDASFEVEDEDTAFKIFARNEISDNLGIEFGYVDLGETAADFSLVSDGTSSAAGTTSISSAISVNGFNAGVVGMLPLSGSVSLNGRAGLYLWNIEAEFSAEDTTGDFYNESFSDSDDGNDIYYGLGLDIGWLSLFYEIYEIDGDDVDLAGLAVKFGLD